MGTVGTIYSFLEHKTKLYCIYSQVKELNTYKLTILFDFTLDIVEVGTID